MDFKYIKNISNGEGTILLYSQIGDSVDEVGNYIHGISGAGFAHEMQYLQDNCSKINVRINSIGGSVLDGYSIVSAILNSKVPCNTYIDGLAASISGVIALAGKKCYMSDYGTFMMHNPSGGSDEAVTSLVKNTLVTLLSNRTKQEPDAISKMMDTETWMDANMCLSMGLVDEIVSSNKKIKINTTNSLQDMAMIYNKVINPKKITMDKITNFLKLTNTSTEEEIVSTIESNEATKDAEIVALNARLKVYEDKENEAKKAALADIKNKATSLVEKAIEDKKITLTEKDSFIELALVNIASVENMFSKISTVKNAVVDLTKVVNAKGNAEDRSNWDIVEWSKKDPEGLEKMKNESPDLFNNAVSLLSNKQKLA